MPELADVEGFRRTFARWAVGRPIREVHTLDDQILRNTSPQGIGRALKGRRFGAPRRHGKWLIAPLGSSDGKDAGDARGGRRVLFHFGMTGGLRWRGGRDADEERGRFVRLAVAMRGGELHYHAQRKIGGVWLAKGPAGVEEVTGPLGPDAAEVGREEFLALLAGRRGGIKSALMDQELLAGLGNELSDEILWWAGIDPRSRTKALDEAARGALYDAMREVLRRAMRHGRIPVDPDWLRHAREQDDPRCPACGRRLRHATVAGRTSWWCPRCQRKRG